MKPFMDKDFMLTNETAKKLYHEYSAKMPIIDYHCHLVPKQMLDDEPFENITQIFLGGDHYKWRYMRSCGLDEKYMTGDAPAKEKFLAFCGALQYAIGNPLYHWTHLELQRYFGINDVVTSETAEKIWDEANRVIKETKMSPSKLINDSNVEVICTTDDPADSLEYHIAIKEKGHIKASVRPTLRPDFALNVDKETFVPYIKRLSGVVGRELPTFDDLVAALYERIDFFNENGCRVSDHALDGAPYKEMTDEEVNAVYVKAAAGGTVTFDEAEGYKLKLLQKLAAKYHELGWAMQLHMGALRNNNSSMYKKLGADTGFDSINDYNIAEGLSKMLNSMNEKNELPRTILYTLNPKDNYVLATMLGNFQSSECAGKIQFGSGWWFNDQRDGMLEQMKALGNLGALCKFVGMLTDSRSFLSYTRHEYFRRIMCNLLGTWVENGEFPQDYKTLGKIVEDISYNNAKVYFGF
ncbi:MAG: glucuronate isomerase [Oscillospiraceae bacterium]|nr:glucuronate isomerase [Oscillospiraceae bacterium]